MLDLAKFAPSHRIIVDTCSFMQPDAGDFFGTTLLSAMKQAGTRIVVPKKVLDEVKKHIAAHDEERRKAALHADDIISRFQRDGAADIFGDDDDPFADQTILYVVQKYRTKLDFLIITQDRALAQQLLAISRSLAVRSSRDLAIARIHRNDLVLWQDQSGSARPPHSKRPSSGKASRKPTAAVKPFKMGRQPAQGPIVPVPVTVLPASGDPVLTESGRSRLLGRKLACGGEGTIYELGPSQVAKIYHRDALSNWTLGKLKLMTSQAITLDGVCWPTELLWNQAGEPVGYAMPRAEGTPLQRSVFVKPLLLKTFPNWHRIELVEVAIAVARIVGTLHSVNVVLGDINPLNILVTETRRVTFVDLDSAQIEEFPCPVGMVNYTRAENHGKGYSTYLRTFEDDRFALSCLIFMILMPGKPPYSHAGGGDPGENIRTRNFPYRMSGMDAEGRNVTPDGPWRFIWSHFPRALKETFCRCFKEGQIPSPMEWVQVLEKYRNAILNGFMDRELGNEIFPPRFRRLSDEELQKFGMEKREGTVTLTCQHCCKAYELRVSRAVELERQNRPSHACPDCAKAFGMLKQSLGGSPRSTGTGTRPPASHQPQGNSLLQWNGGGVAYNPPANTYQSAGVTQPLRANQKPTTVSNGVVLKWCAILCVLLAAMVKCGG